MSVVNLIYFRFTVPPLGFERQSFLFDGVDRTEGHWIERSSACRWMGWSEDQIWRNSQEFHYGIFFSIVTREKQQTCNRRVELKGKTKTGAKRIS